MSYNSLSEHQKTFLHQHLTELQHTVVVCRLEGHTWQRIANAMNLDEATIRGHHKRATRRLANATRTKENTT